MRHEDLGLVLWHQKVQLAAECQGWFGDDPDVVYGIEFWAGAVMGHRGQPLAHSEVPLHRYFLPRDVDAALGYADALRSLFLPDSLPLLVHDLDAEAFERSSRERSWWFAVLVAGMRGCIGQSVHRDSQCQRLSTCAGTEGAGHYTC
ncbi:hypothetical protein [Candidatus Symbiobacter mobilis]|uniref:Uncharacterized protein n=1 Tax=Candidatus Symbiobacter mobilis CR TaxID=946483 RepID=U5NB92_9BURK|nr:hypothetical protein [Candidatus Symbiobacter mobilis]AGX87508.1 hypothetical protein Cenrod_1421 [Candidatus Symbiobacter mobilis CR]